MSKRNEWKFSQTAKDLARACHNKLARHNRRILFWAAEKAKAEEAFKTATVTFKEFEITGGKRVEAVLDPSFQNRLNECASRLKWHESKRDEYMIWLRVFESAGDAVLELHHDDVTYFGLGEQDEDVAA